MCLSEFLISEELGIKISEHDPHVFPLQRMVFGLVKNLTLLIGKQISHGELRFALSSEILRLGYDFLRDPSPSSPFRINLFPP